MQYLLTKTEAITRLRNGGMIIADARKRVSGLAAVKSDIAKRPKYKAADIEKILREIEQPTPELKEGGFRFKPKAIREIREYFGLDASDATVQRLAAQ